jgi:hypothetical protein
MKEDSEMLPPLKCEKRGWHGVTYETFKAGHRHGDVLSTDGLCASAVQTTRVRKRWNVDHQPSGRDSHGHNHSDVVVAGGEYTHYEFVTHLLTE